MKPGAPTSLVLIPSYNTGARLFQTVTEARARWTPVWVVIDGSTDGTAGRMQAMAATDDGLQVLVLPANRGKGEAIRQAVAQAAAEGFTHVLTLDADGQHATADIARMMALSAARPDAMILGKPIFAADAPRLRVIGRLGSNTLARLVTLSTDIGDSLYGMRVYPIAPLLRAFAATRWMRRFDFEAEAAIRLHWMGVAAINLPTPVRYLRTDEGGVSHFHYLRDNLLLAFMYTRLALEMVPRLMLRRITPATSHTDR